MKGVSQAVQVALVPILTRLAEGCGAIGRGSASSTISTVFVRCGEALVLSPSITAIELGTARP